MKRRLLELDGCRGLLCWTVVAGHWLGSRLGWGNVHFSHSYISVDGFFILSGIVLTYIYKEKLLHGSKEYYKFAAHRFERLYPLHLLTFLVSIYIYFTFFEKIPFNEPFATGIYNLFLLHGMGLANSWNWNDPSWSISVEFYASVLAFPLLLKIRNTHLLISLSVILYGIVIGRHHNLEAATDVYFNILSSGFLKCVAGLALGIAIINCSEVTNDLKRTENNSIVLILQTLAIAYVAYFIYTKDNVTSYDIITIVCFTYIFYSLINFDTFWNTLFSNSLLVYFGKISFAIYLTHTPLMLLLDQINYYRSLSLQSQTIVFLSVLIIISHFIYNWFEMPIYKNTKKITDTFYSKKSKQLAEKRH
ncbi:acyltransferase [Pantoea sp. Morm]|uniref:acyltransferase family protein n=1 Tax=Pantoea sp. Morm TaxID=2601250 RepID=UPI0031FBD1CA